MRMSCEMIVCLLHELCMGTPYFDLWLSIIEFDVNQPILYTCKAPLKTAQFPVISFRDSMGVVFEKSILFHSIDTEYLYYIFERCAKLLQCIICII